MLDDPSPIKNKDLDIMLKWEMDCGALPVAVSKNKRKRVAKCIKPRNDAANNDDMICPEWTEELVSELQ